MINLVDRCEPAATSSGKLIAGGTLWEVRIFNSQAQPLILLEPLSEKHLPYVQAHAAHASIGSMSMVPVPYPADGAAQWHSLISPKIATGESVVFIITESGDFRGVISLSHVDKASRAADLDYWVAHDWQAKGIGTTAVALAVVYATERLELAILRSSCLAKNVASARVLEKNGFGKVKASTISEGRFRGETVVRYRLVLGRTTQWS